ncbi:hypothetical protein PAPYR_11413 [Paratrimastix pyriformis]|uniref:Uncharacterized protein n=1 Tax=Paratrimastix pyriformis TaxID=342808 RepID=A0ABQ8U3U0_9EUKA|nr:hypothetical protein PAPYR_11413 [Paratrimastix pyriformis]
MVMGKRRPTPKKKHQTLVLVRQMCRREGKKHLTPGAGGTAHTGSEENPLRNDVQLRGLLAVSELSPISRPSSAEIPKLFLTCPPACWDLDPRAWDPWVHKYARVPDVSQFVVVSDPVRSSCPCVKCDPTPGRTAPKSTEQGSRNTME